MGNRELINMFLNYLKREGKAMLTLSAYATDLGQWEKFMRNQTINSQWLNGLMAKWLKDFSNNSKARKSTSVREFLRWEYRKGYLKEDLAKEIEIPKRKACKIRESISSNKLAKLRRTADVKERLTLELILRGLRLSEIIKIKMKNVKFGHCGDRDSHATSWLGMTDSKKIPITGQLQQAMEYYLATYSRGLKSTLIFSDRTGRAITIRTATNILSRLTKKAGFKGITARDLRSNN